MRGRVIGLEGGGGLCINFAVMGQANVKQVMAMRGSMDAEEDEGEGRWR